LGGSRSLGDIDILAWKPGGSFVLVIECKSLTPARNAQEIIEVLLEFAGHVNDPLARHIRRVTWLREHIVQAGRRLKEDFTGRRVEPFLVTNQPVPMQFSGSLPFPPERIIPASRLIEEIAKLA
jgi:hypothetical protein